MRLGRIGFDHVAGYLKDGLRSLDVAAGSDADDRARQRAARRRAARPRATPPLVVDVRTPRRAGAEAHRRQPAHSAQSSRWSGWPSCRATARCSCTAPAATARRSRPACCSARFTTSASSRAACRVGDRGFAHCETVITPRGHGLRIRTGRAGRQRSRRSAQAHVLQPERVSMRVGTPDMRTRMVLLAVVFLGGIVFPGDPVAATAQQRITPILPPASTRARPSRIPFRVRGDGRHANPGRAPYVVPDCTEFLANRKDGEGVYQVQPGRPRPDGDLLDLRSGAGRPLADAAQDYARLASRQAVDLSGGRARRGTRGSSSTRTSSKD